uniref:Uncharacterized protein n=1 Tax=Manihot esculenta TaxID=3983 RepID=A0A2C9V3M2_MANES
MFAYQEMESIYPPHNQVSILRQSDSIFSIPIQPVSHKTLLLLPHFKDLIFLLNNKQANHLYHKR